MAFAMVASGVITIAALMALAEASTFRPETNCNATTGARTTAGGFSDYSGKSCNSGTPASGNDGGHGGPGLVTRVVDCGPRQVRGAVAVPGDVCSQVRSVCGVASAGQLPTDPLLTTTGTLQPAPGGGWEQVGLDCSARSAAPQVTGLLVMAEVRRLVPHPQIGVAPPGGVTLVNIQTLLWADTPADQSLGTVVLLGHRVALQVRVARVDWDFGDGQSDTTNGPERRYDPAAGCHTVICPGYWGHVYASTGPMTITAAVTWSGRYRVDAGAWLDIPATVTGPAARAVLTVKQARGVLVPNVGER
ncbi:MAG: hypothetical protein ABR604_06620 [Jatrophihabitantaceae bacterium]